MHQSPEIYEDAKKRLIEVQEYEASSLERSAELGAEANFRSAVEPAQKVIELFKLLPLDILADLPDAQLNQIIQQANGTMTVFGEIQSFSVGAQQNAVATRDSIVEKVVSLYKTVFPAISPLISYGTARTVDFQSLDTEARSVKRSLDLRAEEIEELLSSKLETLNNLEDELRKQLAEQGVTQQAVYFEAAATEHADKAKEWGEYTIYWAAGTFVMATASLFSNEWSLLRPDTIAESIQLAASKIVLLGTFAFMLVRSARIYRAHKHGAIINKHKQNALLTYNALVEAGPLPEHRVVILNHAAASIYATPDSGYTRSGNDSGNQSLQPLDIMPKITAPITGD